MIAVNLRGRNLYLNPKSLYRRQETSCSSDFSSALLCDYGQVTFVPGFSFFICKMKGYERKALKPPSCPEVLNILCWAFKVAFLSQSSFMKN